MKMLAAQAADGNGAEFPLPVSGYRGTLYVAGTFGGGTVTLQLSPDAGSTWISTDVTFTAAGVKNVEIHGTAVASTGVPAGTTVRARLNVAGSVTPSLNAWMERNEHISY